MSELTDLIDASKNRMPRMPLWWSIDVQPKQGTVKVQLDPGAYMPTRAYSTDAGADLRTPKRCHVPANGFAVVDTGVHVEIPTGYCGRIMSKSGLNCKHGITADGLVDAGYTGSIRVALHNDGPDGVTFEPGDKIAQLVIHRVETCGFMQVERIGGGERGNNGFGSTGR